MSPKVEEWAAAQQIDLGLAEYPFEQSRFERSGFEVEEFCTVPHLLAVPKTHRLAMRAVARPQDIAGERFISQTRNTVGRLQVDRLFDREGVEREMVIDCQIIAVVANLVEQGLGIGFIDPFTAADFAGRNIVTLRFEPEIQLRLGLLHPTHRPLSRMAREFVALLRSTRRELISRTLPVQPT